MVVRWRLRWCWRSQLLTLSSSPRAPVVVCRTPTYHYDVQALLQQARGIRFGSRDWPTVISILKDQIPLWRTLFPSDHKGLGDACYELGYAYDETHNRTQGIALIEESLSIRRKHLPPGDDLLGLTAQNLALMYRWDGQYERALELYLEALECRRAARPPNPERLAHSLNGAGIAYATLGQYHMAVGFYQEAMQLEEEFAGQSQHGTSNNLALAYLELGDYERAQELLGRVITLRESGALACPHVSFDVLSYSNYALCLSFLSRHAEALIYAEQGVERTNAHRIDPQRPEYEHSRATLAFVLRASGRPDEAMKLLLEAQPRLNVALRPDHPSRIWNTFQQGRCHLDSGRFEAARDMLTRAADLRRNRKPADPHRTAQIVLRLADAYSGLGEAEKASELYLETLECYKQACMEQHPEAREAASSLERLRAITGEGARVRGA